MSKLSFLSTLSFFTASFRYIVRVEFLQIKMDEILAELNYDFNMLSTTFRSEVKNLPNFEGITICGLAAFSFSSKLITFRSQIVS